MATKATLLGWIDDIQKAIELFQADADEYLNKMNEQEYVLDGAAIRQAQQRLARTKAELEALWRRLDT